MSLTSAMLTGVSGLLANGQAMNVIGNNIANVNTVGFKGARSLFSDLLSESTGDNSQVGKGVQMQSVQNFFTQGSTQSSENVTDLAIQGNSFFALAIPSSTAAVATPAAALLTRSGAFRVDSNYYLVNPDGYKVLDSAGAPIKFTNSGSAPTTDFGKITKIDANGNITYLSTDGITQHTYATPIGIVSVPDCQGLTKLGDALYQPNSTAGVSASWGAGNKANGSSEQIISNALEQSNVDMAGEFVKMIVTQRAYSANSKTITTTDQMTQEALNLIR
jgi:flagellar hook protein FlgE